MLWAAIGVALISILFANCKKEDPTYSVQVTATKGGTVEGQNGEYKEGETVVFTAIPADGYYFSQWSDGQTNNPRTITVFTSDISLTAKFIGVSPKEGGTVETQKVFENWFRFKAIPADGYYFTQWSDGNTDNPRTIEVGKTDITLTAEFGLVTISGDLGLESGTIWATCNLGAAKPWDFGDYYAWGETQAKDKDDYSWETYKYCKGSKETLTKYCNDARYGNDGFTDALTTLEATDDAATAVFGADWAMPTNAEWAELGSQCYWVWTENYKGTDVEGFIVYKAKSADDKGKKVYYGTPSASYSLSDAHIFLPAAHPDNGVGYGRYWSSSNWSSWFGSDNDGPHDAMYCYFCPDAMRLEYAYRCCGYSIRPVKRP